MSSLRAHPSRLTALHFLSGLRTTSNTRHVSATCTMPRAAVRGYNQTPPHDVAARSCSTSLVNFHVRRGELGQQFGQTFCQPRLHLRGEVDREGNREIAKLRRRTVLRHALALYADRLSGLGDACSLESDGVPIKV